MVEPAKVATPPPTPTPVACPVASTSPSPSPGSVSAPRGSLWEGIAQAIAHLPSAAVAIFTAWKAASFLPVTLGMVRASNGEISHDVWAWLPFAANVAALIAIAAPVSFRNVLDVAAGLFRLKKGT